MDNYDLSNLPLLSQSADSGDYDPWLTEEPNRRLTFSGRSVTVSTSEQVERQHILSTGGEETSEQKTLADFNISLAPNTLDPLIVAEPENPFAALAAFQPLPLEDDSQHPSGSELGPPGFGFLEGLTAEDLTDVVLTEPEWNDVLEPPEKSQVESDTRGTIIPESTIPDTVSDKRSGKRRAFKPENVIMGDIPESAIKESQHGSKRPTKKRQKLDSTESEIVPLPQGVVTTSQSAAMPEKSADSQKNTEQNLDESFKERVKKETAKWVIRLEPGVERRYVCCYPNCNSTYKSIAHLKAHIFKHIGISIYKCTYPECSDKPYFCTNTELQRHIRAHHTKERPYFCPFCNKHYGRSDNYKVHMSIVHKLAL